MRYYKIVITTQDGKPVIPKALGDLGLTSLLPNGQGNPACLSVEMNIPVSAYHQPDGTGWVRILGLDISAIGSATNLNGCNIQVYGGMSKGLPLATPGQQGLLVQGMILQAYGNWVGVQQTVDLQISPGTGSAENPLNLVLNWPQGTSLADAIKQAISIALPQAKISINISPNLTLAFDEHGFYGTLTEFSKTVFDISKSIIGDPSYPGVTIGFDGVTVSVSDLTTPPAPITIQPQDLIGQPTWIAPQTIQAMFVMRGDIGLQDVIKLPATLITTTSPSFSQFNSNGLSTTTFSGNYVINRIQHYGNMRQPDASSWSTVVEMYPQPKAS